MSEDSNGGPAKTPEVPPHVKERVALIRKSLDNVIHDIAGFLFNQLGLLKDGRITVHMDVEDHQVVRSGYTVQGGFNYKERKDDGDGEPV